MRTLSEDTLELLLEKQQQANQAQRFAKQAQRTADQASEAFSAALRGVLLVKGLAPENYSVDLRTGVIEEKDTNAD